MHAAPARYVSVSELYSTDEVELLLDEIRELEPTSCRGEDVQDFEIAGSGLGACGAGGGGGGRSPCGTELTERSWDSHAHYSLAPPPRPRRVAPVYCALGHLLTPHGAGALLVVACSVAACGCVWALVGVRAWLLPLAGRVRLLLLAALTSALLHATLLFMRVSRLAALLPLDWSRLATWSCGWSGVALGFGGALMLHAVLAAPEYRGAPRHVAEPLVAAGALGLAGALTAAVAGAAGWWCAGRGPLRAAPAGGAAYRAVPTAPPPAPSVGAPESEGAGAPRAGTSRDDE